VHLLGRHPLEEMPAYFERADVMLVSLKDTEIFRLTLPAKVQAYMAAGKPVVAMMNGEGPRVVEEAGCGYSVPAGDSAALAALLLRLSGAPREDLVRMGENGLRYCATHFTFGQRMADLNALFKL
jgi:glycosyltransferase involved in cell wall biosynthesis